MNQVLQSLLIVAGVLFMALNIAAGLIWLERRLLVLATVGSASPFVGLFGTV